MVRRDSIVVLLRRHYGSGGTHCWDPRRLLFSSAEGSEIPNNAPLKGFLSPTECWFSPKAKVWKWKWKWKWTWKWKWKWKCERFPVIEWMLILTKGKASVTAGSVGILELGDLWHRIFWQLSFYFSDGLEFLVCSNGKKANYSLPGI